VKRLFLHLPDTWQVKKQTIAFLFFANFAPSRFKLFLKEDQNE